MDIKKSILLSLDFEGHHYKGTITPSDERGQNNMPIYFRVMLGDTFFAYLCCGDRGWRERDKEGHPTGLVRTIGDYIADY